MRRRRPTSSTANQISLAAAKKIARVCRDWAAAKGGSMSLYIINTAGEFVHMERMDGQVFNNIRTALLKAQTALRTRQPTSIRAAQLRNDPSGLLPPRPLKVGPRVEARRFDVIYPSPNRHSTVSVRDPAIYQPPGILAGMLSIDSLLARRRRFASIS